MQDLEAGDDIGKGSRVTKDVPPYVLAGREPLIYCGFNGRLRRRNFTEEQMDA